MSDKKYASKLDAIAVKCCKPGFSEPRSKNNKASCEALLSGLLKLGQSFALNGMSLRPRLWRFIFNNNFPT